MFKQRLILECRGNEDRIYRFETDPNSPLGEVHDALLSMKSYVLEQINKHAESEKKIHMPDETSETVDKTVDEVDEAEETTEVENAQST